MAVEDRNRPAGEAWAWFFIAIIVVGSLQYLRAEALGGAEALLTTGRLEPAHTIVVENLPGVPVADDHGHDGQIFFAIGSDLTHANTTPGEVPAYRYRRIFYPAMAALGGVLGGSGLLFGMIAAAAVSAGAAAWAMSRIASLYQISQASVLAIILHPGIALSGMLLTADNLAMALGLLGIWAFLTDRNGTALALLAAASLTRETHIVFALAVAGCLWFSQRDAKRALLYLAPVGTLALWLSWVAYRVGDQFSTGDGLNAPFAGIVEAFAAWQSAPTWQNVLIAAVSVSLILAMVAAARRNLFSWLVAPWILIAIVSSHFIWDLGNNAIRALMPLLPLGTLGLLIARDRSEPGRLGKQS